MTFRSLFLSDMHLGFKGCQAHRLLHCLQTIQADNIFLLGDIVDFEAFRLRLHWQETCTDILKLLFRQARNGTQIVYLPGNHDDGARAFLQFVDVLGHIQVSHATTHTLADGRNMLLFHGDTLEERTPTPLWLRRIGATCYNTLLAFNHLSNCVRHQMGIPYWSLSNYLRNKSKLARQHIRVFEETCSDAASNQGLDGVICGHIHTPTIRNIDGTWYANCGDWIENCTAVAETYDGKLVLLDWKKQTVERVTTATTKYPTLISAEA